MVLIESIFLLILLIFIWYIVTRNGRAVPKGFKEIPIEKGMPIIGVSHRIKDSMILYLQQLGKKHGPIFAIRLGMRNIVILNNYEVICKTFKDNSDIFSGRFETEYKKQITHNSGFLFHDGKLWEKQRLFLLGVLRDLGFGKSRSAEIVNDEMLQLLEELRAVEGKKLDFYPFIALYIINIISKFFMSKRFTRGSDDLKLMIRLSEETIESWDKLERSCFMFPFLNNLPIFVKVAKQFTSMPQLYETIFQYYKMEIDDHLRRIDFNSEGGNFIERFLIKQKQLKEGSETIFTEWQMIMTMHDTVIGGFETTATMIHWSCMFLSKFPDIQEKVYLEIVDKVGTGRRLAISDRPVLHYTQAVMDEIMRMGSIAPLNVPHRSLEHSHVNGFFIPKNSIIFSNMFACNYDSEIWEDPTQFKPERFLEIDSQGGLKYCARKELITFSMGRRQCIGESMARLQYFTFLTNIVQSFKISSAEKITDEAFNDALYSEGGLVRGCPFKKFIFTSRL